MCLCMHVSVHVFVRVCVHVSMHACVWVRAYVAWVPAVSVVTASLIGSYVTQQHEQHASNLMQLLCMFICQM